MVGETASNYLNIMSMGDLIIANDIKTQPEQNPPGPFGFGFTAVNAANVNLTATGGNVITANIDASGLAAPCCTAPTGMPGFGGGMPSGGNGGSVNIMGRSVQTGYIHTFGAGGAGGLDPLSSAGRGGDGGSVFVISNNLVINGDINSSGGGGGGGGYMGGSGGNAGSINISVMAPMTPDPQTGNLTIRGPVLAAGGGGGQSFMYATSPGGGGSFGGGGGGGHAGAGGGGFFGGGGSETGFYSQAVVPMVAAQPLHSTTVPLLQTAAMVKAVTVKTSAMVLLPSADFSTKRH